MKTLSKRQTIIFLTGGVLMVVGMGMFVFLVQQLIAGAIFLVGTILFSAMQCAQVYNGSDFTIRRLKSLQNLAVLLFVLAGILMIDTATTNAVLSNPLEAHHRFLSNVFSNWETYIQYVYNKWLPLLLIAVMLELYTTHRISRELSKKENDNV